MTKKNEIKFSYQAIKGNKNNKKSNNNFKHEKWQFVTKYELNLKHLA